MTLARVTALPHGSGTVLFLDGIGVSGARAGVDVTVIDFHGLADPLASRMPILRPRFLPGHEKVLPEQWALAEASAYARDSRVSLVAAGDAPAALRCGDIARLGEAIGDPMTPGRFASNLVHSFGFTRLQIPKDPTVAAQRCR